MFKLCLLKCSYNTQLFKLACYIKALICIMWTSCDWYVCPSIVKKCPPMLPCWNNSVPSFLVVQCTSLQAPAHADIQCQDPIKEHSYTSTCTVRCEEGFDLIGINVTKCSSQGNWSHTLPVCQGMTTDDEMLCTTVCTSVVSSHGCLVSFFLQAKRCSPILSPPHGSTSCSDPNGSFSFGSRCTKTCDEGFLLNGTSSTECTSLGMWSADIPPCLGK